MYNFFMTVTAFGISIISKNLGWLKIILYMLNIGLFLFILGKIIYKEGQIAYKERNANDIGRKQIIETGKELPLKVHEEYKPWKGYFIGFLIGAPILICLLIHTVLISFNVNYVGAGAVAGIIYMQFFGLIDVIFDGVIPAYLQYFILPYGIALISVVSGVCYNLGANKIQKQYDAINQRQEMIYGKVE